MTEIELKSGRKIGPGHPAYIVAEVGSNWLTLEDCLISILMAKHAGADAVKFQAYSGQALYGLHRDWSLPGQLPLEWLPNLKEKAERAGIDFMCTAFSPELVDAVDPFVEIHKVASAELTHGKLLKAVMHTGKPVFLSSGASGEKDIEMALSYLMPNEVVLLYCVAAYPACEVDLDCIQAMNFRFNTLTGFSDHTTDVLVIPRQAVRSGACVIEKHFAAIDADTPDRPHSLNVIQFSSMVKSIRGERAPFIGFTREEQPMVLRHNRRLIATVDIPEGGTFQEAVNFGAYRSLKDDTHALSPFAVGAVHGRQARRAIKAGDGIGPGDF